MRVAKIGLLVALSGCIDFGFTAHTDRDRDRDTDVWVDPDGDVDTAPPDEVCNGIDDDGDGAIDEGHPDLDGDGIADCVDRSCDLEIPPGRAVPVSPTCGGDATVEDPWDVRIEWQWTGLTDDPRIHNVVMTPVIGNLTDTDRNGVIDTDDVPDVAAVAFADWGLDDGYLVVLAGETGEQRWAQGDWNAGGGIALADIDGDGLTDIVGFDRSFHVKAVRHDGSPLWTSEARSTGSYPQATVADMDGDGIVEVIADTTVLDGRDGSVHFSVPTPALPYFMPTVGDLDQDGDQELIIGSSVYSHTGELKWVSALAGSYGHWAAIFDADGDPEAEVAMVGGGELAIYQHDGTPITRVLAGTGQPGAPCVADFDGDGDAEIAWASSSVLNVYELDGTPRWSAPVDDSSGLASCSGYGVNGDGAYEVLYADQGTFYIFDGTSGIVQYKQAGHASGTLWEYPSVADVDRDGSAEIVIGSNNGGIEGWGGITAFGQVDDGWLKSGTTWHTHDFAVTNINADGTVPARPDPWWQIHNVYRARPADDRVAPDLQVELFDVCFSGCERESLVQVSVQVSNVGKKSVEPGVLVTLYTVDGAASKPIETRQLPLEIPAGQAMDAIVFSMPQALVGSGGFVVRVDDDGRGRSAVEECDEDNNQDWWNDSPCLPR